MADNNVIITFQFQSEGQSGVLSAVDAINERIKQGQQAQPFNIANVPPGGESEPWRPPSVSSAQPPVSEPAGAAQGSAQIHLPDPHEAKEFGASIETANKSLEVLVRGVESFGRILTTGRLNVAVGGFNQIGESVRGVAERFGEAGEKIGFMATAVTAAIAGFGAGAVVIKELGEHAAEAVNGFQELAAVAGLSSEKFAALKTNFAQFGVGMETVQRLVRLTSVRIQEEWGSLVHAQRTAADDSVKLSLDVREATRREEEAESQARLAPFGETEAQEKIKEAEARERLAPLGVLRAEEGVQEAETKERFAPFGILQAQENVQEAEAKQRFVPHARVHAEAGLEEAQLAIPKGELTTEGAHTSLLQAQLNYNKVFGTTEHPVAPKYFAPGSNEGLAYEIQRRQAEEGLKQAQLQEKSAEIKNRETKGVEGGIPEAEEALRRVNQFEQQAAAHGVEQAQEGLRKAGYQERIAPLEVDEAREGLRKAHYEQEEAAPHAVAEADEGLLRAKREEAAASDEVTKAAIGVREALLALKEFPQKNAPALAEAIGKDGGAGVPWAEVPSADIFRALTLRGVNQATGVPDLQGVLKQVTGFYNLPGVPEAAKAGLGAEITGGRGAGLAQVIAALTEQAKNKNGIFEETDRSKGLAASMDAQKAASEEYRTTVANADIDKEKALVDVGKRTIPLAGVEEKGVAASIQTGAEAALGALDGLAASAHATVAAGEGVISTFNKISELGARQTPEYQAALAAHPEVKEAINNETEANKAVTNYSEQKLSGGEGSWEERFHALQSDPQYQALQAKAGQASSASETLQHNLAVQTVPSIAPKVEGLNAPIGGGGGAELKDAAEQLKEAASALKGSASSGGEGHSTGGYISGPGTGTSDSIRAPWLSNGEYVIKADRVAEVGVDRLDDLNEGRAAFAEGGFIQRLGYADGGLVTDDAGAVIDDTSTIDVPRERRTDEQIRAKYRDNLDVQLLSARVSETDKEDKERKLGITPPEQAHSQEFTPDKYGPKHWSNPVAAGEDGLLHTTTMKHNFPGYPIAEGMVQSGAGRQWVGKGGEWQEQEGGRPHPRAGAHHTKDDRYRPHDSGLALSGVSGEIKRELPEEIEEERSASPITPYEHSAGGFKTLAEAMGVSQPRTDSGVKSYADRSGVPDDERRFFGTGPSTVAQQEGQEYSRLGFTPEQQEKLEHARLGIQDDKKKEEDSNKHISIDLQQHQQEYSRLGLTLEQQEKKEHERLGFAIGGIVQRPSFAEGGSMFASGGMIGRMGFSTGGMVGSAVTSSSGLSGHYALDVTTDHGTIHAMANEDMLSSLSQSALASKLTRSGITPTWGS